MKYLLRLICMAVVLLTFTQCGKDSEPEPEPEAVTETWQLTYDDYHTLVAPLESKYKNLIRNVTIVRKGDEMSIQGIFPEYPEAWTKFTIKYNNLYFAYPQTLGTDNGKSVYMHWGYASDSFSNGHTFLNIYVSFVPGTIQAAFTISDDGSKIIAKKGQQGSAGAFWYNNDENGALSFDSLGKLNPDDNIFTYTGTGFPDIPNMINMVFSKVSDIKK